jgi:hypothetical protein
MSGEVITVKCGTQPLSKHICQVYMPVLLFSFQIIPCHVNCVKDPTIGQNTRNNEITHIKS